MGTGSNPDVKQGQWLWHKISNVTFSNAVIGIFILHYNTVNCKVMIKKRNLGRHSFKNWFVQNVKPIWFVFNPNNKALALLFCIVPWLIINCNNYCKLGNFSAKFKSVRPRKAWNDIFEFCSTCYKYFRFLPNHILCGSRKSKLMKILTVLNTKTIESFDAHQFVWIEGALELSSLVSTTREHSHIGEKDHCTAGLQFNKSGIDQQRKYVAICM